MQQPVTGTSLATRLEIGNPWQIRVLYGPHGAPDFFTDDDVVMLQQTQWKVHYNSNRTGVRLIGPKPQWARKDGGEAGLQATVGLLKTLQSLGGFYLSLDVVDAKTLREAQQHPERYLNLSVRIAGWSSHFVTLDDQWQEMIIERTTHGE